MALSPDSLARRALPRIDYLDAYAIDVDPADDLEAVCTRVFGRPPPLFRLLMGLRDAVMGPLGLKTTPAGPRGSGALTPGQRIGIFRILERTPEELLLGEDDRHLDFRVSLRVPGDGSATLATLVQFRNAWGRLYFFFVRPFHASIARAMLERAAAGVSAVPAAR